MKKVKKPFSRLSKAEKRVQIAKDVISQLETKKMIASHCYVDFSNIKESDHILDSITNEGVQLQKVLPKLTCEVCAKGSLFISSVTLRNSFKITAININGLEEEQISYHLSDIFEKGQLDTIETAYETEIVKDNTGILYNYNRDHTDLAKKAVRFGKRYTNSTNRLKAICRNIIENKGTFVV